MKENKQPEKVATIQDVATEAGVAIGTVSRYLNGYSIRQNNRQQVESAIAKLNYQTNSVARAMKTSKTYTIAFVVPNYDEFNSAILTYLIQLFRDQGYMVVTYHYDDNATTLIDSLSSLASRRIDGIIMSGALETKQEAINLMQAGKPVILFNNDIRALDIDRVLVNNTQVMKQAVNHLIASGHRKIGIITGDLVSSSSGSSRYQGYVEALAEAGIELRDEYIVKGKWRQLDGYVALESFRALEEPPTAFIACNYLMATGALEAMKEHRLIPGEEFSVISFDDVEMFRLFTPSITAIAQPTQKIAHYLTDLMLTRLEGDLEPASRTVRVPCDLILRESIRNIKEG